MHLYKTLDKHIWYGKVIYFSQNHRAFLMSISFVPNTYAVKWVSSIHAVVSSPFISSIKSQHVCTWLTREESYPSFP